MLFYIFYNISCKAAHKGNKQLRQSERVHTGFGNDGNGQNRLSAGGYRHFAQPLTGLAVAYGAVGLVDDYAKIKKK